MSTVVNFFLWIFGSLMGCVGFALLLAILFGVKRLAWASGWFLFESLTFLVLALLFFYAMRRADRLSLIVGTVLAGSPEEKKADRVVFWFELTEDLGSSISILSGVSFLLTFIILNPGFLMYFHLLFTVLVVVLCWYIKRRFAQLQSARGYGGFKRLSL